MTSVFGSEDPVSGSDVSPFLPNFGNSLFSIVTFDCPSSELLVSNVIAALKSFLAALSPLIITPSPDYWVESSY